MNQIFTRRNGWSFVLNFRLVKSLRFSTKLNKLSTKITEIVNALIFPFSSGLFRFFSKPHGNSKKITISTHQLDPFKCFKIVFIKFSNGTRYLIQKLFERTILSLKQLKTLLTLFVFVIFLNVFVMLSILIFNSLVIKRRMCPITSLKVEDIIYCTIMVLYVLRINKNNLVDMYVLITFDNKMFRCAKLFDLHTFKYYQKYKREHI